MSADIEHLPLTALEVAREATSPTQLVALAIANGTPADTLARLLDVQERWSAMQAKKEFDAAMANFKSECPSVIAKESTVDFTSQKGRTHYKYADRADITEIATPFLSKFGLSASFETDTETPNMVKVTCELSHKGGHSKKTSLKGPVDTSGNKNALQAIGSAVEYLSRYTFNAALGLATKGQDDDGRAAGQPIDQGYREPSPGNGGTKPTEKQPTASGGTWFDAVAKARNNPDPAEGEKMLAAIRAKLPPVKGTPSEARQQLDQAIADADNALAIAATLIDPPAPADGSSDERLKSLEQLLAMCKTTARLDEIAASWQKECENVSENVYHRGLETIGLAAPRMTEAAP